MGSGVDMAIDLDLCIDFLSNLYYFVFATPLVYPVPILLLTFLCRIKFAFSKYISLWIAD